jgi:DNA-binding NarL/FixJ family response regulator
MARVLVVEDEFIIAAHIGALLDDAGFEVVGPAGELQQAVDLAATAELDAATLDINIEGAHIGDLTGVLAKRGIPFLFVSGYGRDHIPAPYRDRPLVGKPFEDETLVKAVRDLIADAPSARSSPD